jgi:hypothetical protein
MGIGQGTYRRAHGRAPISRERQPIAERFSVGGNAGEVLVLTEKFGALYLEYKRQTCF